MKKIIILFLIYLTRAILSMRYRVKIEGLEKLTPQNLHQPGGVLFLPNHTAAFVDPLLIEIALLPAHFARPLVVEYMYYTPFLHTIFKLIKALPVPNFDFTSNSLKQKRSDKAFSHLINDLKNGDNFLLYPSGRLKLTAKEIVGGASGLHHILQEAPQINLVLVRLTGLWGSSFSRAQTGQVPQHAPLMLHSMKMVLMNLLFFIPKREILIQIEPAPANFPYTAPRMELNKYLEDWYNQPGEIQKPGFQASQVAASLPQDLLGESLTLVPDYWWSKAPPKINSTAAAAESSVSLDKIPPAISQKVIAKIAQLTKKDPSEILPNMDLSTDLGLDSLDAADLSLFLNSEFGIENVLTSDLTSVSRILAIASKQITLPPAQKNTLSPTAAWWKQRTPQQLALPPGNAIIEVFLNNCQRQGNTVACADTHTGIATYADLKMRTILLAKYIQTLPGAHVGILLPSSSTAYVAFMACELAGKIPIMINWTVGRNHLENVLEISQVKAILSSWSFLDQLPNADLEILDDRLIFLEDFRRSLTLKAKLTAYFHSKKSTSTILAAFGCYPTVDSVATILFTSGSENLPKAVPLTHGNILSNCRAITQIIDITSQDIMLSMLPPFHSFGLTTNGLLGLLIGLRLVFTPDPKDGQSLYVECKKWGITFIPTAPTFLLNLFKAAKEESALKNLRFCFIGAEKAPLELQQRMVQLGIEKSLLEGYGITECSPVLTANRPGTTPHGVGLPMPGVEIKIVNYETYQSQPAHAEGLILAFGPNVFHGYLNKNTTSPFIELDGKKWYKTGDLGYLDDAGNLTISGRLKRFVKIGGEMISLSAIENALQHTLTKNSTANAPNSTPEGPQIAICAQENGDAKAKFVLFTTHEMSLDEANNALQTEGYSNLVRISSICILPILPLTGIGKINYRQLENSLKKPEN